MLHLAPFGGLQPAASEYVMQCFDIPKMILEYSRVANLGDRGRLKLRVLVKHSHVMDVYPTLGSLTILSAKTTKHVRPLIISCCISHENDGSTLLLLLLSIKTFGSSLEEVRDVY